MGASIAPTGPDTYRIRWSQVEDGKRRQRQTTVRGTRSEAEADRNLVLHDLKTKGYHDPAEHRARYAAPANLLEGLFAWLDAAEKDKLSASTVYRYRGHIHSLAKAIHEATAIPETEALPVTVLTRPLFDDLKPILGRRGDTVPSHALSILWTAWGWLVGDPKTWHQIPHRPPDKLGYVPAGPRYGRTEAPTLGECDAMLRHLRKVTVRPAILGLAVLQRYTGLRVGQCKAVHLEDIDMGRGTLVVRKGKSKREQAEMRTIPLSFHLLAEPLFRALVDGAVGSGRIIKADSTGCIKAAWEASTVAGEVRRHTWAPPNRKNGRKNNAFRAALQAHMTVERVRPDVIDHLVGHSTNLRATHYGPGLEDDARSAVDDLPPVDWMGPKLPAGVVPFEAHSRTG